MPGYAGIDGLVGAQQTLDLYVPDTNQQFPLGQVYSGVDPFFGYGEFVYGKASAAMGVGRAVFFDQNFLAADVPNTANLGCPVLFASSNMAINTFGWFRRGGMGPAQVNATVAAGAAIGIAAAGILGTNTAGKQLLNARVIQSQTYAPTYANVQTQNGDKRLFLSNVNGLFVGLTGSGTGISGTIAAIDPSGNMITMSAAASATGLITATFTWTGFSLVYADRSFTQGAIT